MSPQLKWRGIRMLLDVTNYSSITDCYGLSDYKTLLRPDTHKIYVTLIMLTTFDDNSIN